MSSFARRSIAVLVVAIALAAGCGDDDDVDASATDTTQSADEEMGDDILAVAAAEGDLGTFLAATEAAGIMDGLHGEGPFTVFAPTDDAFSAYLESSGMSQSEVFGDAEALRTLLDYHVVNMAEPSDMVMSMAGQSFETAAGLPLDVTVDGETVMVGNATVERYDIEASNGVIHVIDGVLIPPEE
jgi:uncharacterized surface protein with fasciclin (FAS1) repeats